MKDTISAEITRNAIATLIDVFEFVQVLDARTGEILMRVSKNDDASRITYALIDRLNVHEILCTECTIHIYVD